VQDEFKHPGSQPAERLQVQVQPPDVLNDRDSCPYEILHLIVISIPRSSPMRHVILVLSLVALWTAGASAFLYEVKHEGVTGNAWYGGDDRPSFGPRHVGKGQSVFVDSAIQLESFSLSFDREFDYFDNPEGVGHEVTLVLHVRDTEGVVLQEVEIVVPDTYEGGWVTWEGIDLPVAAGTTLIFTSYLTGAYDTHQYTGRVTVDSSNGYPHGGHLTATGTSDADLASWSSWGNPQRNDLKFWLVGSSSVNGEQVSFGSVKSKY
jgi:hypothetical protein